MIRVELLHVADCPHVDAARSLLAGCLDELGVAGGFEDREGAFPSPTILVNGKDVMGAPSEWTASCRLDVPTRERVLAALTGANRALESPVRGAAFRLLLETGRPLSATELALSLDQDPAALEAELGRLHDAGRVRLDEAGNVTGSAGLSVVPDRHEIVIDGRPFWTWCAYDILGIFAALGANGSARTVSPADGSTIELNFEWGRPSEVGAVLFVPDPSLASSCANVYEEWCPRSNLFPDAVAASTWARAEGISGEILGLARASELAAGPWLPLT